MVSWRGAGRSVHGEARQPGFHFEGAGQVFAAAVHLMLTRVLTVGLAANVRSSAGAITVLFVALFVPLLVAPTNVPSIRLDSPRFLSLPTTSREPGGPRRTTLPERSPDLSCPRHPRHL
ncbi:hypothetical protein ACWGII_42665 [Streptomyces sp. NPDC054855]